MLCRLSTSDDPTLTSLFVRAKQDEEMTTLQTELEIPDNLLASGHVSSKFYRDKEFSRWCELPQCGKGVKDLGVCSQSHKWIMDQPTALFTGADWRLGLLMRGGVAPVNVRDAFLPNRTGNIH